jgi:hypothetical protein
MTFLLSEDKALRDLLLGMTVTDQKSDASGTATRNVGVWFGQPDQEMTEQKYPYITIDMIDISEDFARAHRGLTKPSYLPDPATMPGSDSVYDPATNSWEIHWPIPVNIDYQITTYSRQPRHDREILATMLYSKLPLRFGVLQPDDNTVRRLNLLDVSKRDITEAGKRLFVNAFTVRVSSEIAAATYTELYKALQVDVTGTTDNPVIGRGTFTPISFTIHS